MLKSLPHHVSLIGSLTIRPPICLAIVLSMGVIFLLSPTVGSGAVPIKKATYRGETSQGRGLALKMSRRSVRRQSSAETQLRTQCGGGKLTLFALAFDTRVTPGGRFRAREVSTEDALELVDPIIDSQGRRRRLLDVTRFEFSGRFVTRRRVRGQWRARSVLLDQTAAFESNEGVFDRCDTGAVAWSARLRRR